MANFKFSPDLFLEVAELERFKLFLDDAGFRKNIRDNSVNYGLIKSNKDITFPNGRVEQDFDSSSGGKTIKIKPLNAIDRDGLFLYQKEISGYQLPGDSQWYWLKVAHRYSNIEKGTFSIGLNGHLTCTTGDGELTRILRGMPNFPSRIRFVSSTENNLEYDVLEVIDDNNAILQHPSVNSGGVSAFNPETGLQLAVVGTFTPGVAIPEVQKYPFQYDSCLMTLVPETATNSRPPYTPGKEFYLARISVQEGNVIIQDKRVSIWETKGSELAISIDRSDINPLIGVEAAKWDHNFSPAHKNLVEIGWGARTQNWTIDSSKNIVTLLDILGGKYKTTNDFNNGDFNGWRIYTGSNGKYSRVISSIKQGSSINLTLDVLDVDDYSADGGSTFYTQWVHVVPNCEEVEIRFIPNIDDDIGEGFIREFTFPVNTLIGKCDVLVYKKPSVLYEVYYRYKSYKEYTDWKLIPSDEANGYYKEISYNEDGTIKDIPDRVRYPYVASEDIAFIELDLCPWAYRNVIDTIYKGDLIDVWHITDLSTSTVINVTVGETARYIYISGHIVLTSNVFFNMVKEGAQKGNEFRIHIDCESLALSGGTIIIAQDDGSGGVTTLKQLKIADVYSMLNQDGGICFDMVFEGDNWVMYQNYKNEGSGKIETYDGVIAEGFDWPGTGWGKVAPFFGKKVCDGTGGTPNLQERFLIGSSSAIPIGSTGGSNQINLTEEQLPEVSIEATGTTSEDKHGHRIWTRRDGGTAVGPHRDAGYGRTDERELAMPVDGSYNTDEYTHIHDVSVTVEFGKGKPIESKPAYYAVFYVKNMY